MSLITPPKAPVELATDQILDAEQTALRAVSAAVSALTALHSLTWGLPDGTLLGVLNATGIEDTQKKFAEYELAALAQNGILDRAGYAGRRAPIAPGRELMVVDGIFAFVPPPVEPDPEPAAVDPASEPQPEEVPTETQTQTEPTQ